MFGILYFDLSEYLLYERSKSNITKSIEIYVRVFRLMQDVAILYTYNGATLVKRICYICTLSGMAKQALPHLESLRSVFKPDIIPKSCDEYLVLCSEKQTSTLLECVDIIKNIVVIKVKEKMKYYEELGGISNIYKVIYEDNVGELNKINSSF